MNYSEDIYAKTNAELIIELGSRFKEYRLVCRLTQKQVAWAVFWPCFVLSVFLKK